MKSVILFIVLAIFILSGCSVTGGGPISQGVGDFIGKDAHRGAEIAAKYGAPEIATCLTFVEQSVTQSNALVTEDTNGVLSLSVKLYLLAQQLRGNQQAEAEFKSKCGAVAAGLLLEVAKRGPIGR